MDETEALAQDLNHMLRKLGPQRIYGTLDLNSYAGTIGIKLYRGYRIENSETLYTDIGMGLAKRLARACLFLLEHHWYQYGFHDPCPDSQTLRAALLARKVPAAS